MRALCTLSLILFASCSSLPSDTSSNRDQLAVLEAVHAFLDVIESKDAEAATRISLPEAVCVSVSPMDGERRVGSFRNSDWIAGMSSETRTMREYFVGEPTVLVEGDVAVVFGSYVFELEGEVSHTGVDAFNLVRTDEGWKLAGGAFSMVR